MSCSRCGQSNRAPRSVPTPSSIVGRPGGYNVPRPGAGIAPSGLPNNVIKSAITGLRYVPGK